MLTLITRIVASGGTIATAIAVLFFSSEPPGRPTKAALWALIALAAFVALADTWQFFKTRPKTYKPSSKEIVDYLVNWLGKGGRTAVFTRDMSWASGAAEYSLKSKATKGELMLCVGRRTSLIDELVRLGAAVYDYSAIGFEPESRFTIIDYKKFGSRVAIGVVEETKHVIREFDRADEAVMSLARDMVGLIERVAIRL